MTWRRILRIVGIGAAAVAAGFGLSFVGLGLGTAAAQGLSMVTGALAVGGYAVAGIGGVAAAGKGLVNGVKYLFNIRGYKDQVRERRTEKARQRAQTRQRRQERRRSREERRQQRQNRPNIFQRIGNFFRRRGNQQVDTQHVETNNDDIVTDVDELNDTNVVENTVEETQDEVNDVVVEDVVEDTNDVVVEDVVEDTNDVVVEDVVEDTNDVVVEEVQDTVQETQDETVVHVEPGPNEVKKPSTKAGGLYDSLDEDNKLLYDTISSKTFTNVFARMTHDQYHEYLEILKNDVEKIKTKAPSKLTKSDVQTLALVDKMIKTKHVKVQVEGKRRYAPTKKESKGLTEEEIKAKSDELALYALLDRTDVSEEEIEKQRQKNQVKNSGR